MELKKMGIYPFNKECFVFQNYSELINKEYKIIEIASLNGWGMVGKKVELYSSEYQIKSTVHEFEENIDVLYIPDFNVSESFEKIIVEEVISCISDLKMILCSAKFRDENLLKIKKECCNRSCEFNYLNNPDYFEEYKDGLSEKDLYLKEIDVPIIAVAGLFEDTDKFDISLELRKKLINDGYRVSQIGSRNYSELFGFHSFPKFMLDPKMSENEKPILFNRYISKMSCLENPDIIILSIPGAIQPLSEELTNDFGILSFLTFQSILVDFLIICTFYQKVPYDFFVSICKMCEYRFSCPVDVFHMSNLLIDIEEIDGKKIISTNKVQRSIVEKNIIENYSECDVPIINMINKENVDIVYEMIKNKLSNNIIDLS